MGLEASKCCYSTTTTLSYNILLLLFVVTFVAYSCVNKSDRITENMQTKKEEKRFLEEHNENFENLSRQGISAFLRKYNSDPLPNRTDTRTAYEMCSNFSDYYCVPPLRNYKTLLRDEDSPGGNYVLKNHYRLDFACKNLEDIPLSLLFLPILGSKEDNFHHRFCKGRNEVVSMQSPQWRFFVPSEDGWMHTMVTREPVDRFLSGFVHICIRNPLPGSYCNGCKANMTCFIIKEYERMVAEAKKDNFAQTREDNHFFPQNWRCELFRNPHPHFIRYSSNVTDTMLDDLFEVLKVQNATQPVVFAPPYYNWKSKILPWILYVTSLPQVEQRTAQYSRMLEDFWKKGYVPANFLWTILYGCFITTFGFFTIDYPTISNE